MVLLYKQITKFIVSFLLVFVACSIGPQYSGGAGAGNPATLAMIANGVDTTMHSIFQLSRGSYDTIPVILPIKDSGCLLIDVNGVFLLAQYATFPAPDSISIPEDIHEPLYYDADSNEIVLDGPFLFDVLRGTSAPDISFKLPDGLYESMSLYVGPHDDTLGQSIDSLLKGYQIVITGTFTYEDTLRDIGIYILCDEKRLFPGLDGGVNLFDEDFVELIIGLDEEEWLDSIGIKGCIKKKEIFFDDEGHLTILDNTTGQGPAFRLCERIRNNIFNSGVFRHRYPTK